MKKSIILELNRMKSIMGIELNEGKKPFSGWDIKTKPSTIDDVFLQKQKIKDIKNPETGAIIRTADEMNKAIDDVWAKEADELTLKDKDFIKKVNDELFDEKAMQDLYAEIKAKDKNLIDDQLKYEELVDWFDNYFSAKRVSEFTKVREKNVGSTYLNSLFKNEDQERLFRDWYQRKYGKKYGEIGTEIGKDFDVISKLLNDPNSLVKKQWDYDAVLKQKENRVGPFSPTYKVPIVGPTRVLLPLDPLKLLWKNSNAWGKAAQVGAYIGLGATASYFPIIKPLAKWYTKAGIDEIISGIDTLFRDEFGPSSQNGPLVRQIMDGTLTIKKLEEKYDFIDWRALNFLDENGLRQYASAFMIAGEQIFVNTEDIGNMEKITKRPKMKFNPDTVDYINSLIYSLPDGVTFMAVAEQFTKIDAEKRTLKDYLFDELNYVLPDLITGAEGEINDVGQYNKMTNAGGGQEMILSLYLPTVIFNINLKNVGEDIDKQKEYLKTELDKYKKEADDDKQVDQSGQKVKRTYFDINSIKIDFEKRLPELQSNLKKFTVISDINNWVIVPPNGVEYVNLSDYVPASGKTTTINQIKELYTNYLKSEMGNVVSSDMYDIKKIVKYINDGWGNDGTVPKEWKGKLNFKNVEAWDAAGTPLYEPKELEPKKEEQPVVPKPVTPKPVTPQPPPQEKRRRVARENHNIVGLGKLLTEQSSSTTNEFDWQAALFQNHMDQIEPSGWKGTPKKRVNKDTKNGWGTFDKETLDSYTDEVDADAYPKQPIGQVEKIFFPMYNKKFLFEFNDSGDFITLQGNQTYYNNILNMLNYGSTTDFEVIFLMGIMKVKELANQTTSIQVSDATEAILKKNESIIKQILNPKNK